MRNIFVICSLVLFLASCAKVDYKQSQSYTFSVNGELEEIPVEQDTKVTLAHTMKMTWTKGDAVSVVNLTKGMALGGTLTADQTETRSTFSGTVTGNIDNGDQLALIYPSLGYSQEQPFANAVVDFSSQDGTDKTAKFCAVAVISAETSDGNFVEADTRFYMKSAMLNVTLADLPVSTVIEQVTIPDLYSQISLSVNSKKNGISASGINGTISMHPNSATSVHGIKGLYFGFGGAKSLSARRPVSVTCDGALYESDMTGSAIANEKFYTLSVGAFVMKSLNSGIGLNYNDDEMGDGGTVVIGDE